MLIKHKNVMTKTEDSPKIIQRLPQKTFTIIKGIA